MKKTLSLFLTIIIIVTMLPVSAFAADFSAESTLPDTPVVSENINVGSLAGIDENDIFITSEEAGYIAGLFVDDTIAAGISSWNHDSHIVSIVTMYDQTAANNITAYSVEFDKGYVIVSAYLGIENIIIEWSDTATPLYKDMEVSSSDKVVYLGALAYYKDSGRGTLETRDGFSVSKLDVTNSLACAREVKNVPQHILSSIAQRNNEEASPAGVITNPYNDANNNYAGPFQYSSHINNWDSSSSPLTVINMSRFNCKNHCGPTAISNMIKMYGNRFNVSSIKSDSVDDIFGTVLWLGNAKYYYNADISIGDDIVLGGTINALAGAFIKESFAEYGLSATCTRKDATYDRIKFSLLNDYLLYVMLENHGTYGNHAVVGYAYTRLVSTTTGNYKTYLKVADGWSTNPRYVDMATMASDTYWEAIIR